MAHAAEPCVAAIERRVRRIARVDHHNRSAYIQSRSAVSTYIAVSAHVCAVPTFTARGVLAQNRELTVVGRASVENELD